MRRADPNMKIDGEDPVVTEVLKETKYKFRYERIEPISIVRELIDHASGVDQPDVNGLFLAELIVDAAKKKALTPASV